MRLLLAGLALLLLAPATQACSLAYQPFAHATFHGEDLWYVDGTDLRQMRSFVETTRASGFFLSYALLPEGRLLVAGQQGLGADCSGDNWLELRGADGTVVWRRDERAEVFPHADGPFVATGGYVGFEEDADPVRYWRLDGEELVPHGQPSDGEAYLLGWTADGHPIEASAADVHVGNEVVEQHDGSSVQVAAVGDGQTGLLAMSYPGEGKARATLHILAPARRLEVSWPVQQEWGSGLAWAGGAWHAVAGGRAYRTDGSAVVDLGIAEARTVAPAGGRVAVFTEEGYTVFDGTDAVEAWRREGQVWAPMEPDTEGGGSVSSTASVSPPGGPGDEGDVVGIPAPGVAALAVALAAVALRRRPA